MGEKAGSLTVRELLVKLGVVADLKNLDTFDKRLKAAKEHLASAAEYAGKARDQIADLLGYLARGAAAVVGFAGGLVYQAKATSDSALQIERQAMALGLSVEKYQELQGALQGYGVDQRDFADLMAQITQQASASVGGAENISQAFKDLGVDTTKLKSAQPEEILRLLADGMASTTDDAKRLSAASTLLGEDLTKKASALLMGGSKGLDAYGQKLRDLGAIMSEDDIKAAKAFSLALGDLGHFVKGLRNQIGMGLIPVLTDLSKQATDYLLANREIIRQRIDHYVGKVRDAFLRVRDAIMVADGVVRARFGSWERVLYGVAGAVTAVAAAFLLFKTGSAVYYALAAFGSLASAVGAILGMSLAPAIVVVLLALAAAAETIAMVLIPLALLYLALDDVYTYVTGGRSALGTFIEQWSEARGPLGAVARFLESIGVFLRGIGDVVAPLTHGIGILAQDGFGVLAEKLGIVWAAAKPLIDWAIEWLIYLDPVAAVLERMATALTTIGGNASNLGAILQGTVGQATTTGEVFGGVRAAGAALFAPAPGTLGGATGGARTTNNTTSSTEQRTYQITASDPQATVAEIARYDAERRRNTAAGLVGGDE
jgi:hypothetical protein